jgi:hypothetical protein
MEAPGPDLQGSVAPARRHGQEDVRPTNSGPQHFASKQPSPAPPVAPQRAIALDRGSTATDGEPARFRIARAKREPERHRPRRAELVPSGRETRRHGGFCSWQRGAVWMGVPLSHRSGSETGLDPGLGDCWSAARASASRRTVPANALSAGPRLALSGRKALLPCSAPVLVAVSAPRAPCAKRTQ